MQRLFTTIAAAAAVLTTSADAFAQPGDALPARKPGQWEIRMVTEKPEGVPAIVAQACVDASTDREMMEFGLKISRDACKRYAMKREGPNLVIDAECKAGPVASATRATLSGDFQSSYTVRIEGTAEGLPLQGTRKGPQPTLIVHTGRWMGGCTNGLKPGDISMGKGAKLNVKQMRGMQKLLNRIEIR